VVKRQEERKSLLVAEIRGVLEGFLNEQTGALEGSNFRLNAHTEQQA
jgi:hypothetical protein